MKRVLVIDDDVLIGRLLREHLSSEGFSVETVTLGEDGFTSALNDPPDLIMLDVNLPDVTGFQLCGRFRQHSVTRATPIIMMTGAARYPNQQLIGRQLGANDYILKPFDVVKVGEKIHALLGTTPAAAPSPAVAAAPETKEIPIAPALAPPAVPVIMPTPEKTNGARPNDPPAPVLKPVPAIADSVAPIAAMGTPSFEANTAPRVETVEAAPPAPIATPPEPIWYELPLGSIHEEPAKAASAPVESPLLSAVPTIIFSTETPAISAPAEQLEAPLLEAVEKPASGPNGAPASEEEMAPYNDTVIDPPPGIVMSEPAADVQPEKASPWRAPAWFSAWRLAWSLLGLQALLVAMGGLILKAPAAWILRSLSFTVGGWAVVLGLLAGASAALQISLTAREAVEIIGFAAISIVVRSALGVYTAFSEPKAFVHFMGESTALPSPIFWTHPLDIFQIVSLVVIGWLLSRRPGASFRKALSAAAILGIVWALLGRGYFKPF